MAPILARIAAELTYEPCNVWRSFGAHFDGAADSQCAKGRLSLKAGEQCFKGVPAIDMPHMAIAPNEPRSRDTWAADAVDFDDFTWQRKEQFTWST